MKSIMLICPLMAVSMSANSDQRIEDAEAAFQELMHTPDKGIHLNVPIVLLLPPDSRRERSASAASMGGASLSAGDAADGVRRRVSESKARVSAFSSAAHQL